MFKRRKTEEGLTPVPGPAKGPTPESLPASPAPMMTETVHGAGLAPSPQSAPLPQARRADPEIGVPPFRTAAKEVPAMGRSPFASPPAPPASQPAPGMSPPGGAPAIPPRPGIVPGQGPRREPAERRTLIVGRGISVQGTVTDAERLMVEGTVEATMIHTTELVVAQGGVFKGEVEAEDTDIAGVIDGTLTARGNMIVRSTGKVLGTARCRRLQVEDGGQITGRIEMITEPARDTSRAAPATDTPAA